MKMIKKYISEVSGRLRLLWLALILGIAGTAFAQKQGPKSPWFFIQISDPQFGMFENNASFEKETILYEAAVNKINKLNPDFVVITGDFVHNSNSDSQIQEFKRITAKINPKIPVYLTPGNHDLGQTPDKKSREKYKKNYGDDKFSFKHKGSTFIGFNTSLIKAKLIEPEKRQYKWLTKKLKKNQEADHLILFCHYPFFNKSVDEPTGYSNIDLDSREKYLTLFKKNKVDALFSGHLHNNKLLKDGQTQYVTTSAVGKPLGEAPSGMRIIKIYSDKIEHAYFGLEKVPDSIQF
jgi:3',5'-cyclic AMP phosphodiesterase CpdA